MCRDLNELVSGVCLYHVVYYSGDGRNGNGKKLECCRKTTVPYCG